jgi:hypothetical protein
LVEQRIENPRVGGSIPSLGTIKSKSYWWGSQWLSNFSTNIATFAVRARSLLAAEK